MLVFGGNTHNDTSMSHGAKCFSSDFLVYNLGKQHADASEALLAEILVCRCILDVQV